MSGKCVNWIYIRRHVIYNAIQSALVCNICVKVVLVRAGLASYQRSHENRQCNADYTTIVPDRHVGYLRQFCNKICRSNAELTRHMPPHGETLFFRLFKSLSCVTYVKRYAWMRLVCKVIFGARGCSFQRWRMKNVVVFHLPLFFGLRFGLSCFCFVFVCFLIFLI